jgi:hypothetical protein
MLYQFLVLAGNWQFFCYDRKKMIQSSVWRVRDQLRPEKKEDTVVCLLGARFWRLQPEKKDTVVCLAGCAVVSVFGSGGKLAVFLLWREIFITTRKKKIFCGRKVLFRPEKKVLSIFLWWKSLLRPEKKVPVVIFTRN